MFPNKEVVAAVARLFSAEAVGLVSVFVMLSVGVAAALVCSRT